MWIYTRRYFTSIVDNHEDYTLPPGAELTARFRNLEHAQAFHEEAMTQYQRREDGPEREHACSDIRYTPKRDYPYRVVVVRSLVGRIIGRAAANIAYPNFKDVVQGDHHTYAGIWAATLELGDIEEERMHDLPEWQGLTPR